MQAHLIQYGDDQAKTSPYSILLKQGSNPGSFHRKHSSLRDAAQLIPLVDALESNNTQTAICSPDTHSVCLYRYADTVEPLLKSLRVHDWQHCSRNVHFARGH